MKYKIKDFVSEILIYDLIFISMGFILMKNMSIKNDKFVELSNILLTFAVIFVVTHFDNLKEIVKKMKTKNYIEIDKELKEYISFRFELVLIILTIYLFFIERVFNLCCLRNIILSLSFGLLSALLYALVPIHRLFYNIYLALQKWESG